MKRIIFGAGASALALAAACGGTGVDLSGGTSTATSTGIVMSTTDTGQGGTGGGGQGGSGGHGGSEGTGGHGGHGGAAGACGDGAISGVEACDDGNTASGDGCSSSCAIEPGWTCSGTPSVCKDIDECATNNGGCDANATCTNTVGSRTCACKGGYTGNGLTCTDVDECLTNNGGCDANATCTNTLGSRACACNFGYTGGGLFCMQKVVSGACTLHPPTTAADWSFSLSYNVATGVTTCDIAWANQPNFTPPSADSGSIQGNPCVFNYTLTNTTTMMMVSGSGSASTDGVTMIGTAANGSTCTAILN